MNELKTEALVADHLKAARALLEAGLMEMKRTAHDEYQAVALSAKLGGFFQLKTAMSPAGLCETTIDLVAHDGQTLNLMRVETTGQTPQ